MGTTNDARTNNLPSHGFELERPTKDEMFLEIAQIVATRSTCQRNGVGVIITNWEGTTIVSMGYNGNARGMLNMCDTQEPGACGCIHAETNALIKAPYNAGPLVLYSTVSPCAACAKLILNSQVVRVVFRQKYRNFEVGAQILQHGSVDCVHLPWPPEPGEGIPRIEELR